MTVGTTGIGALSPAKQALLEQRLRRAPASRQKAPMIPPRPDPVRAPLSFIQRQMWFIDRLTPGNPAYNMPYAFRLRGPLDVAALERGFNAIIARHESLRTSFEVEDDEPVQRIHSALEIKIAVIRLDSLPTGVREDELRRLATIEALKPFDLARLPLLRVTLFRLDATEHVLLMNPHHIVADGLSVAPLMRELDAFYRSFTAGVEPRLPALELQYGDFAHWQRAALGDDAAIDDRLGFWRGQLAASPPALDLPSDHPRPPSQSFAGSNIHFDLPARLTRELRALGEKEGATTFMTLLAAFQTLLRRYTGVSDFVVGTPVSLRTARELDPLIGLFLNVIAVRCDMSDDPTFVTHLRRTRDRAAEAFSNGDLPLERLIRHLAVERDPSRNPVFQVAIQQFATGAPRLGLLDVAPFHFDLGTSQFDLTLHLYEEPTGVQGRLEYCTALFDEATMRRMAGHFVTLLENIVRSPGERLSTLPMLPPDERDQLLIEWNRTATPLPPVRLTHELVLTQAARTPGAVALVSGDRMLTYAALAISVHQLATHLRGRGARPGTRVGIALDRSPEMVIAMLAILESGAAYVPLDPGFPEERLRFMVSDADLAALVTTAAVARVFEMPRERLVLLDADAGEIAAAGPRADVGTPSRPNPGDPAYLIYTSGSTGRPKGVVVPHRAVVNLLTAMAREPGLAADDVLLAVTTLSFDIAVLELLLPLIVGARVVIAPREATADGGALGELLQRHRVTVMQATPVSWRLLLDAGVAPGRGFKALVGGESLPKDLADALLSRGVELWNMYGPTETTVWSTCARITGTTEGIPIGRPIANTVVRVLDERLQPCPIGVSGQLCIGGTGVALGYWKRPELTAERFVPDPFGNARAVLYLTGDRARWRSDGTLEHQGRLDDQVKVHGYRIEVGEVEAAISSHPAVRDVAVAARDDAFGGRCLVGYVVAPDAGAGFEGELRNRLRAVLAEYMVPRRIARIARIPRTPNGKIDRKALPDPAEFAAGGAGDAGDAGDAGRQRGGSPRSEMESVVLAVFRAVLGRADVGIHDSFFDLGGDSLMAARLVLRLGPAAGRDVAIRTLFERPTPAALADAIAPGTGILNEQVRHRAIVPLQPRGTRPPIFAVPGHNGYVFAFRALARSLGDDQPLYGLQPPGLEGGTEPLERIEDLANTFAEQIRAFHPAGPCVVAGLCAGGMTAFEVGRLLVREQRDVTVVLLSAAHPSRYKRFPWLGPLGLPLEIALSWVSKQRRTLRTLTGARRLRYAIAWLARQGRRIAPRPAEKPSFFDSAVRLRRRLQRATLRAAREYVPGRFEGRLLLLASNRDWLDSRDAPLRWRREAGDFEVHCGPDDCDTDTMLQEPAVGAFAGMLRRHVPSAK